MNNIINLSIFTQYKFLYTRGKDKDLIYHVWAKTHEELIIIVNFLKNENKAGYCIWMTPGGRIRKDFVPIPSHHKKLQDNFFHGYAMIGGWN